MKNIVNKALAFLAVGFLLSSCEENAIVEQTDYVTTGANVRFSVAAQDAPTVNFYLNDQRITAKPATADGFPTGLFWSSTIANTMYPGGYGYANVPAGSYTLRAIQDATTTIDTTIKAPGDTLFTKRLVEPKVIASVPVNLTTSSNFSAYLVGMKETVDAVEKTVFDIVVVNDEIPPYDFSKSFVRFVNVMSNAPGNFTIKAVGTDPVTDTVVVATNIPFKGQTNYVAITPGVYNISVFMEGKPTAYTTWTAGNILPGRTYTFFTRGNYVLAPGTINRQLIRER